MNKSKGLYAFLAGLALGLILLPFLTGLWLVWMVQLDTQQSWLKQQIISSFEDSTGLQLDVPGFIDLQLEPLPTLHTESLTISAGNTAGVSAKRIEIQPANLLDGELKFALQLEQLEFLHGTVSDVKADVAIDSQNQLEGSGKMLLQHIKPVALFNELIKLLPELDLAAVLEPEGEVLQDLHGSIVWNFVDDQLELTEIALQVDETRISGRLGYNLKTQRLNIFLQMDRVRIDDYLNYGLKLTDGTNDAGDEDMLQPALDILRELNAEGQIEINSMVYADKQIEGIHLSFGD